MTINNYFQTEIWVENKPEYLKSIDKTCNKYIKKARNRNKEYIKKFDDFGISHHSTPLLQDNSFRDFKQYIGEKSWDYLDAQGYNMSLYTTFFSDMWVQEFSKKGGGHHSAHIHSNQHVSGFYFLKCSKQTSYPVFHDPRTASRATKLKMKNNDKILGGTELVHFNPAPGALLIFPGYLEHEFIVDRGVEPFRFIHWNIQAVPKLMAKDV